MEISELEKYMGKQIRYAVKRDYSDKIVIFRGKLLKIVAPNAYMEDVNQYAWRVPLGDIQFILD